MNPPLNLRVHAIRCEIQDIVNVELRDVDGKTLSEYVPGTHIELHLGSGLVCSYSLCGIPEVRDRCVVGVLPDRNSRGGSCYVHEQLRVSSTLKIGDPRNHFEMDETAPYIVLAVDGIGVTPIVCMARRLAEQGKALSVLYCARSRADAAFTDEFAGHDDAVCFHLDVEAGGPLDLKALLIGHSTDMHFYCCGLGPMLRAFEAACEAFGYTNVRIERFAVDPGVESVQGGEYQVKFACNGAELCVLAGKLLLDVLLEIGVEVEHNYKEGVRGSCETRVLGGEPDHRGSVLSKSEHASNRTMMVRVSRCKGKRLVVGL